MTASSAETLGRYGTGLCKWQGRTSAKGTRSARCRIFELAVIAGHRPREVEEGREWRELLQEAQALAALVRVKAEEDEAARAAAKREAAKARAEAELAKTPEDPEADQPEPKAGETSPQEAA